VRGHTAQLREAIGRSWLLLLLLLLHGEGLLLPQRGGLEAAG